MAIYHLSAKPVQRSQGRSATAAAAYRSGSKIKDQRDGRTHDYRPRRGVDYTALVGWSSDRESLWNEAELAERRKDATTAREYEVAIPQELSGEMSIRLVQGFALLLHHEYGVAVDVAIHDFDTSNPHAHVMATTRPVVDGGLSSKKASIEWSDKKRKQENLGKRKDELEEIRASWAEMCNYALEMEGFEERIDHRSYERQGLECIPGRHLGPAATALLRRGEHRRADAERQRQAEAEAEREKAEQEQAPHQASEVTTTAARLAAFDAAVGPPVDEADDDTDEVRPS